MPTDDGPQPEVTLVTAEELHHLLEGLVVQLDAEQSDTTSAVQWRRARHLAEAAHAHRIGEFEQDGPYDDAERDGSGTDTGS